MKENEVFFVSEEYSKQIKAQDFYDNFKTDSQSNVVEEMKIENGNVYLTLTDFNYVLSRHYVLSEIYINNNCIQFKTQLDFEVKRYTKIENKKPELVICLDQEKFWEVV